MALIRSIFYYIFLITFFCGSFGIGGFFAFIHYYTIDWSALEHYNPGKASVILDASGNEWMQFALDKRQPIEYHLIPPHVIHAFCAAEDWHFFSHSGLSYKGIIRSVLVNIYHGKKVQGASTITQQLVKLLFFDGRKTFSRKIKEQLYALLVEQQFSKEHILQTYLNHVYFGCGIYGIEAAAQRFWGISACDLTIPQAALLAGVIRRPEYYCPLNNSDNAQKRKNIVLQSMCKRQWISKKQCEEFCDLTLTYSHPTQEITGLYIKEMIRYTVEQLFGKKELYTGGLTIQTTIDASLQKKSEAIFKEQCAHLRELMQMPINGGSIAMEPATGEIKAWCGGDNFYESKWDRVWHAHRQLGSIIKPLIYTAAIQKGRTLDHVEIDEPFSLSMSGSIWQPRNYDKKFHGPLTLAYALSRSSNIVAIKTLLDVGAHTVTALLEQCHITAQLHTYPSLALGCIDVTLIEATAMLNIFANNGVYVKPHFIRWIKDNLGSKIYRHEEIKETITSSHTSGQITKALTLGLQRVRPLFKDRWFEEEALSKTGTTNDSRTCWFIGSTPSLTTGVYVGCDDNRAMGNNVFPLKTAFPIWLDIIRSYNHTKKTFDYDPRLKEITIDRSTGKSTTMQDRHGITILI